MSNRFESLPRYKQTVLIVAVGLLAMIVLAALAEGAVRLRQWIKHGHLYGVEKLYHVDTRTGLRIPIAGVTQGGIAINSLGFRGPEIAVPKPPGTIRIAFIGASTTFCAEVSSNEATWPHLVTQALQERWPDRRFDYVNAGVPGYGVEASRKNLELRVKPLEPDVIVIYHATNDLSANSYELARAEGLVQGRTEQSLTWLSDYSLLWYLAEKNLRIILAKSEASDQKGKLRADQERLAAPFRRDLSALVKTAQDVADVVAVATFAIHLRPEQNREQQARAAETSLYYMPYMSIDGLLESFANYNRVIRDVASASGAILIGDETSIPGTPEYFVDSVHFTDAGSGKMAQRVVKALTAGGMPSTFGL